MTDNSLQNVDNDGTIYPSRFKNFLHTTRSTFIEDTSSTQPDQNDTEGEDFLDDTRCFRQALGYLYNVQQGGPISMEGLNDVWPEEPFDDEIKASSQQLRQDLCDKLLVTSSGRQMDQPIPLASSQPRLIADGTPSRTHSDHRRDGSSLTVALGTEGNGHDSPSTEQTAFRRRRRSESEDEFSLSPGLRSKKRQITPNPNLEAMTADQDQAPPSSWDPNSTQMPPSAQRPKKVLSAKSNVLDAAEDDVADAAHVAASQELVLAKATGMNTPAHPDPTKGDTFVPAATPSKPPMAPSIGISQELAVILGAAQNNLDRTEERSTASVTPPGMGLSASTLQQVPIASNHNVPIALSTVAESSKSNPFACSTLNSGDQHWSTAARKALNGHSEGLMRMFRLIGYVPPQDAGFLGTSKLGKGAQSDKGREKWRCRACDTTFNPPRGETGNVRKHITQNRCGNLHSPYDLTLRLDGDSAVRTALESTKGSSATKTLEATSSTDASTPSKVLEPTRTLMALATAASIGPALEPPSLSKSSAQVVSTSLPAAVHVPLPPTAANGEASHSSQALTLYTTLGRSEALPVPTNPFNEVAYTHVQATSDRVDITSPAGDQKSGLMGGRDNESGYLPSGASHVIVRGARSSPSALKVAAYFAAQGLPADHARSISWRALWEDIPATPTVKEIAAAMNGDDD